MRALKKNVDSDMADIIGIAKLHSFLPKGHTPRSERSSEREVCCGKETKRGTCMSFHVISGSHNRTVSLPKACPDWLFKVAGRWGGGGGGQELYKLLLDSEVGALIRVTIVSYVYLCNCSIRSVIVGTEILMSF